MLSAIWAWACPSHRSDMDCIYPRSSRPGEAGSDRMLEDLTSANHKLKNIQSSHETNQ